MCNLIHVIISDNHKELKFGQRAITDTIYFLKTHPKNLSSFNDVMPLWPYSMAEVTESGTNG